MSEVCNKAVELEETVKKLMDKVEFDESMLQLQEECAEVVQAFCKVDRAKKGYTDLAEHHAMAHLVEEITDLMMCLDIFVANLDDDMQEMFEFAVNDYERKLKEFLLDIFIKKNIDAMYHQLLEKCGELQRCIAFVRAISKSNKMTLARFKENISVDQIAGVIATAAMTTVWVDKIIDGFNDEQMAYSREMYLFKAQRWLYRIEGRVNNG